MKKGEVFELSVLRLAFGGKGIAYVERPDFQGQVGAFVVFVDGALPGQVIKARIMVIKKKYAEAKLLEIITPSSEEIAISYQAVPGAPWARLPIAKQLEYKTSQVFELFKKFAAVDLSSFLDEVIPSPEVWNYRNKMEFSFGVSEEGFVLQEAQKVWHHSGFALGSKKRGQYWLVENLERPSGLFDEDFECLLPVIRAFCEKTGFPVFNQKTGVGFFRHLVVRKSCFEDAFLVNLVTMSTCEADVDIYYRSMQAFASLIEKALGGRLKGVFWSQNDSTGDSAQNFEKRIRLYGEEKLVERIHGLDFEISLDSFFQTNSASAEKLYQKVVDYAHLGAGERALDLYCGTGTIGQILAQSFPRASVFGVEIVEAAVEDAQRNSVRNGLKNISFFCEDVRRFLKAKPELIGAVSLVVLDPPRAGLSPKALQRALDLRADNLIYVSCNPATMARDMVALLAAGYRLNQFALVDQFPHTSHVECVGKFCL